MAPNLDQATYAHPVTAIWSEEQQTKVWGNFLEQFATIQSRFPAPIDRFDAEGKHKMQNIVMRLIERRAPITLVLPSFPFKSPNSTDKVLGKLPDRAEELSLARLERFCCEVEEAYPPGCKMVIFSDGRVFNDLLGVSLSDLRAFENELQAMVTEAGHTHIYFDSMDNYVKNVEDPIPEILERFNVLHMDFDARIKTEPAIRNTYCSFCKFLERDLAPQWVGMSRTAMKRSCGKIAKQMMHRNVGFSALVDDSYPDALRISIHQYNNTGPKFGIHLIPQKSGKPRTPWHSVICEDIDGTVRAMDLKDVDTDKYDLVYKHGRKWGFVERPPCTPEEIAQWAPLHVELIRTHMFIIARAMEGFPVPSIMDVPREAIRSLVLKYGLVTLRGFKQDDDFETATERWGDVLQWPEGNVRSRQHLRHQDGAGHGTTRADARGHVVPLRRYVQEEDPRVHGAGRRARVHVLPLRGGGAPRGRPEERQHDHHGHASSLVVAARVDGGAPQEDLARVLHLALQAARVRAHVSRGGDTSDDG
ncbi:hypothetical protein ON010_g14928 [Phytophthora cinnamomi]|nr:hypothetical protein ON010_g14928 [Phytophthora cinnamomi]